MLMKQWGTVRFQLCFIFPGPDDVVILSEATLREILGVDMMQELK